MKQVDISYTQGGIFSIPLNVAERDTALKLIQERFESEDGIEFEVTFNDKVIPWDTLEPEVSLMEKEGDSNYTNIQIAFEVNATIEIADDADSEESAYSGIGFTLGGYEKYFDVKHTEMLAI